MAENKGIEYKVAMLGVGQAGCQIVDSIISKCNCLKENSRYGSLLKAMQMGEDNKQLNVWGIDLDSGMKKRLKNIPQDNILWPDAGFDGAGGKPGVGEEIFKNEDIATYVDNSLNEILHTKANILIVSFSTAGGTGASWGPLLVNRIAELTQGKYFDNISNTTDKHKPFDGVIEKGTGNRLHIFAFIILPESGTGEATATTVIYSLGKFLKYAKQILSQNSTTRGHVRLIPIIISNELIIRRLSSHYRGVSSRELYQLTNPLPADILSKLLYTTLSEDVLDYTIHLDPNDISGIASPERPFVVPFFADIKAPPEGSTHEEAGDYLVKYFEDVINDYMRGGELSIGFEHLSNQNSPIEELIKFTQNTPLSMGGVMAPLTSDIAQYRVLPLIYGTDKKLISPIAMESLGKALVKQLNHVNESGEIKAFRPRHLTKLHYVIELAKVEKDESKASILTLLGGPMLSDFSSWLEGLKELIDEEDFPDEFIKNSVGLADANEFYETADLVAQYMGVKDFKSWKEKKSKQAITQKKAKGG